MIRILIADDHAIVRAGLKQFIADQADMEVTAEASSGSEAIAAVRARDFDVVLLDISMPDKNGIDTLKTLKHVKPELPVLMLSAYAEDQYAINLLRAGAAVSKIADELNLSVKTVSTYRTRILEKMAMKSNADLTYYAIKNGLIE